MAIDHSTNWNICELAPAEFLSAVAEHPLLVQVLYNRGIRTADQANSFLSGSDAVTENLYQLCDMRPAVNRILEAIEAGEIICVYGDFDADGVSATALLVSALQAAGGQAGPYIPKRIDEGYGLNVGAVERIAQKANLLVTVDCGIRSIREVEHAQSLGLDVIITDHHSVGAKLPPALATINPRRNENPTSYEYLSGTGVAYRLAQAVLRAAADQPWSPIEADLAADLEESLLEYVAIGTVADMMPLLGDNRHLVRRGLAQLNRTERIGLQSLIAQCGLRLGTVDATAISFRLAPRINAAGRLADADIAYKLLRTTDPGQAFALASELEELNQRRRSLTEDAQAEVEQQLADQLDEDPPILIAHTPNILPGVVGLVAGKLVERYYRPAVVIEQGREESRGSARSIPEFDISQALDEVGALLVRHGGHSRAAGFTVRTDRLSELASELHRVAAREMAGHSELRPTLRIDAEVPLEAVDWSLQEQFTRLEPTGQENESPLLLCRRARVREARTVGGGKHLRLIVDGERPNRVMDAVAFSQGEWAAQLSEGASIDLVFRLEANEWQGRQRLQLNVQDLRLTE